MADVCGVGQRHHYTRRSALLWGRCRALSWRQRTTGNARGLLPAHGGASGGRPIWCYGLAWRPGGRSEEHTSELQSLMRISSAVFCLKKKMKEKTHTRHSPRKTILIIFTYITIHQHIRYTNHM